MPQSRIDESNGHYVDGNTRGPALKRDAMVAAFSGALKRSFPLLKQGAPTVLLRLRRNESNSISRIVGN
jgi:hypothetical protein